MTKYKLVGMMLQPEVNYDDGATIRDWKRMQDDTDFAFDQLLIKYQVDSDNIKEFNSEADYLLDDDADGIYLYEKVGRF